MFEGPVKHGLTFTWGGLGRCTVEQCGPRQVLKFRAENGVLYQVSEPYWRRMAEDIRDPYCRHLWRPVLPKFTFASFSPDAPNTDAEFEARCERCGADYSVRIDGPKWAAK